MKELKTYHGKLDRYVWHVSLPKHRESIISNGLVPQSFENSRWRSKELYYPPSVFVNNHSLYADWFWAVEVNWNARLFSEFDFWRIDTQDLANTWCFDYNLYENGESLLTMEPIPSNHLRLYRAHNIGCVECNEMICGLSTDVAFLAYGMKKESSCKRIHNYCFKEREKVRFDMEELGKINGLNRIKNLPEQFREEKEWLVVDWK